MGISGVSENDWAGEIGLGGGGSIEMILKALNTDEVTRK